MLRYKEVHAPTARREVSEILKGIFQEDAEAILNQCLTSEGFPLGYDHIDFLLPASGLASDLVPTQVSELRAAYVLISGYYFLLDSVVDEHLGDPSHAVYLTHLLVGAMSLLDRVLTEVNPSSRPSLFPIFCDHVRGNADAVLLEIELRQKPFNETNQALYRDSAAGRSNSALFFYRLLCLISNEPPAPAYQRVFADIVVLLQDGDDYSDWADDLAGSRSTPFLLWCQEVSGRGEQSHEGISRFIYLGGGAELWLAKMIRKVKIISEELQSMGKRYAATNMFLRRYKNRLERVLKDILARKLEAGYG